VVEGLTAPLAVVDMDDGSGRLLVVEQGGMIRLVEKGALTPAPFLDISDRIISGGERGLLGLAVHPKFPDDRRIFVNYTDAQGRTAISSFTVDPSGAGADPNSEVRLMTIDDFAPNHNGGGMVFGPDGFLYISTGDGGGGGDPQQTAQNLGSLLGKILRIDVDRTESGRPYAIPPGNPFAGRAGAMPEIFLYGLRNPWRLSFDRATGDLWIGDVGQGEREEIDVARAGQAGLNFGWSRMEGDLCFRPPEGCDQTGLTMPLVAYGRGFGSTIIGGYVYRGTAQPLLSGGYVYADFGSGRLFALNPASNTPSGAVVVGEPEASISSFGEDEAGEIYVTDLIGGGLYRVVADPA
jgi:glucose/arabinose dehydrogenase